MDLIELKKHDGKEEKTVYIAYNGKVYDVSSSEFWKGGLHMNRHNSGEDLTEFLSMAPHGTEKLEKFKVIAELTEAAQREAPTKTKLRLWYRKFHPHPVLIHYPLGLLPFGAIMLCLYLLTGKTAFEASAYYALLGGSLLAYPVVAAGIFSWWLNYEMELTGIFKLKLIFSVLVLIFTTLAVCLRIISPEVPSGIPWVVYSGSYFLSIPCLFIVAYNGGRITWPG